MKQEAEAEAAKDAEKEAAGDEEGEAPETNNEGEDMGDLFAEIEDDAEKPETDTAQATEQQQEGGGGKKKKNKKKKKN